MKSAVCAPAVAVMLSGNVPGDAVAPTNTVITVVLPKANWAPPRWAGCWREHWYVSGCNSGRLLSKWHDWRGSPGSCRPLRLAAWSKHICQQICELSRFTVGGAPVCSNVAGPNTGPTRLL